MTTPCPECERSKEAELQRKADNRAFAVIAVGMLLYWPSAFVMGYLFWEGGLSAASWTRNDTNKQVCKDAQGVIIPVRNGATAWNEAWICITREHLELFGWQRKQ